MRNIQDMLGRRVYKISLAASRLDRLNEDCAHPVIKEILERRGQERLARLVESTP